MVNHSRWYRHDVQLYGVSMETVAFPDKKTERLIGDAMDQLGNWVESQIELGLNPVILIGLMETYKSSLAYNLLIDEEYED